MRISSWSRTVAAGLVTAFTLAFAEAPARAGGHGGAGHGPGGFHGGGGVRGGFSGGRHGAWGSRGHDWGGHDHFGVALGFDGWGDPFWGWPDPVYWNWGGPYLDSAAYLSPYAAGAVSYSAPAYDSNYVRAKPNQPLVTASASTPAASTSAALHLVQDPMASANVLFGR